MQEHFCHCNGVRSEIRIHPQQIQPQDSCLHMLRTDKSSSKHSGNQSGTESCPDVLGNIHCLLTSCSLLIALLHHLIQSVKPRLQLPHPLSNPILYFLRNLRRTVVDRIIVQIQRPLQLLICSIPVLFRVYRLFLRLLPS